MNLIKSKGEIRRERYWISNARMFTKCENERTHDAQRANKRENEYITVNQILHTQ